MAPEDKNIPITLCEFHSISPSVGQSGPKCSTTHLPLMKATLVPQGVNLGCLQARKLLGMMALNVMTFLGHVVTELGFDEP